MRAVAGVMVLLLALAQEYGVLLLGAMLIGVGSAVFHPESSRVARIASGDPLAPEHWDDIAGYAKLVADWLRER